MEGEFINPPFTPNSCFKLFEFSPIKYILKAIKPIWRGMIRGVHQTFHSQILKPWSSPISIKCIWHDIFYMIVIVKLQLFVTSFWLSCFPNHLLKFLNHIFPVINTIKSHRDMSIWPDSYLFYIEGKGHPNVCWRKISRTPAWPQW